MKIFPFFDKFFFDKKSNLEKKIIMEFKEKDLLTVALSQPEINILKEDIRDEDEFSSQFKGLKIDVFKE